MAKLLRILTLNGFLFRVDDEPAKWDGQERRLDRILPLLPKFRWRLGRRQ